jgi:hypothetical protein
MAKRRPEALDLTTEAGQLAALRQAAADPFSDTSEWMSEEMARASFDKVADATLESRDAETAILQAKVTLHAAVKQRQIASVLAAKSDLTAKRLLYATIALVVATVVLAASTVALPFLEHRYDKKEPVVVVVTQTP